MADGHEEPRSAGSSAGMGTGGKIAIVAILAAAVVAVVWLKGRQGNGKPPENGVHLPASALPRLVDLGAGKCIPCKMMAPILDELRETYKGKFEVEFIDVWENPDAGKKYGIRMIPTQIFYDAAGKELFRHEGFFSREDILGKWKELGFPFGRSGRPASESGRGSQPRSKPLRETTAAARPAAQGAETVAASHPGLAAGVLSHARLGKLPGGVLVQSGSVKVSLSDLNKAIAAEPEPIREQLRQNAFFVLEQEVVGRLLPQLARKELERAGQATEGKLDVEVIEAHFDLITKGVAVSDTEVARFYAENRELFGGAKLKEVESQVRQFVLQERKQQAVAEHLRTSGRRVSIVVSAAWTEQQAKLSRDNPLDKLRWNGKPTLAVFSGASCCGPDKMLPIVEEVREKLGKKADVVYLDAKKNQVLSARYGVRAIPTTIIYDKDGVEASRKNGLQGTEEIMSRLKKAGA